MGSRAQGGRLRPRPADEPLDGHIQAPRRPPQRLRRIRQAAEARVHRGIPARRRRRGLGVRQGLRVQRAVEPRDHRRHVDIQADERPDDRPRGRCGPARGDPTGRRRRARPALRLPGGDGGGSGADQRPQSDRGAAPGRQTALPRQILRFDGRRGPRRLPPVHPHGGAIERRRPPLPRQVQRRRVADSVLHRGRRGARGLDGRLLLDPAQAHRQAFGRPGLAHRRQRESPPAAPPPVAGVEQTASRRRLVGAERGVSARERPSPGRPDGVHDRAHPPRQRRHDDGRPRIRLLHGHRPGRPAHRRAGGFGRLGHGLLQGRGGGRRRPRRADDRPSLRHEETGRRMGLRPGGERRSERLFGEVTCAAALPRLRRRSRCRATRPTKRRSDSATSSTCDCPPLPAGLGGPPRRRGP